MSVVILNNDAHVHSDLWMLDHVIAQVKRNLFARINDSDGGEPAELFEPRRQLQLVKNEQQLDLRDTPNLATMLTDTVTIFILIDFKNFRISHM